MASMNKVIIVGNLGRDPEIRRMPSGDATGNTAVATSYKWKDRNTGESRELTEWHRIAFFGRLAEIVGQYLKKGSSIYVEGRLQTHKYSDKDGVERYATDIIAEQMLMLGGPAAGRDVDEQEQSLGPEAAVSEQAGAGPSAEGSRGARRGGKSANKGTRSGSSAGRADERIPLQT